MRQNEIFSTICIEGKTNEASGRAPSDPPGARKFKADPEQDPRVPIAFHPRGLLNFQSCYKKANSPLRNDSVTATSLRTRSREAYPNAGIAAAVLTGKTETPENEQFLAPGVFCCLKAAHPVGGFFVHNSSPPWAFISWPKRKIRRKGKSTLERGDVAEGDRGED